MRELLANAVTALRMGPAVAFRLGEYGQAWAKHEPTEPHWHIGPVGVEPALQGRGIGSQLMEIFCARLDASDEVAHLETDTAQNVPFYQRFRFEVVAEDDLLGVHHWFMYRGPSHAA